jgi:type IV pilus assembly protein PilZ
MTEVTTPRQGILTITIKEKSALYAAYMPFVINGGLFIPTTRDHEMGQEVFILLNLMEEVERLPIAGKVIWITPPRSGSYRASGIGVQFIDQDAIMVRNKIETYLAGGLTSDRSTYTM